jgi:two-component system, NtrC family, sensor histidine kinase HydH
MIAFGKKYGLVLILLATITFLHYSHESHLHELHGVYRLFFFLPIILGGFRGGKFGGLMTGLMVSAAFYPHAFMAVCSACGSTADKIIEMALYVGVGLLTGTLSDHLMNARNDLQRTLVEKTAMEDELLRSTRLAAVGRLSAGLAHEIRNPLASIQGSAEVLADDFDTNHPKGRMLSILMDEARRLNSVLTKFLEFARNEPGEFATFSLLKEAGAVAELLRHHPDFPEISCVVISEEDDVMAQGNREQIRQVLLNLGLNAAAACGTSAEVSFVLDKQEGYSRCLVMDTGAGFSPEAMEQFGTPFFSTRPQGTGLGLATSLKIVEDQGGTLKPGVAEGGGGLVVMMLPSEKAGQSNNRKDA